MGSVVLSVDAGLRAPHDGGEPSPQRVERVRDGWLTLVDVLAEFGIPATWAVTARLLSGAGDAPGPGSGPRGLVAAVRGSAPAHELALQPASPAFDGLPPKLARRELITAIRAAHGRGLEPRTAAFPRGGIGHRDLLAELGFTCYRGTGPEREPSRLRRLARAFVSPRTPPLVRPRVDGYGLVDLPVSLTLLDGPRRGVPGADRGVVRARRGIDAAADGECGVLHARVCPVDLAAAPGVRRLRAVLTHLDDRRDAVEVARVDDLADRALADPTTAVIPAY